MSLRYLWRGSIFLLKKPSDNLEGFLRIYYFLFAVISTSNGEAIQIEEYVPTIVPNKSARVNPLRLSGPKKKSARRTINTVDDVRIDRPRVSWIDLSMTWESPIFLSPSWRFDLILSITTIVSLIEYPRIVRSAVKKNVSILNSGKKNEAAT